MAQQAARQQRRDVVQGNAAMQVASSSDNPLKDSGFDPSQPLAIQMLMKPDLRETVQWLCQAYSSSATAPVHVRNNPGVVLSALDMSLSTGLNPHYLMNCMFDPGNGKLGLMAEAILAALLSKKLIKDDPIWEEHGDWDGQAQGKFKMVQSQNAKENGKSKGKYAQAQYTDKDEEGLGMSVTIHWADRPQPNTYGPYWLKDQHPRFSTLWATDPRQQIKNKILRMITRQKRPDLLNGMPNDEEAHPNYYGPDNAKDVSPKTPSQSLDSFAEKNRRQRPRQDQAAEQKQEPREKTNRAATRQQAKAPEPVQGSLDNVPWPEDEDDGRSYCEPDQFEGCMLWLSPEKKPVSVPLSEFTGLLVKQIQRATSVGQVLDLNKNNEESIKLLGEDDRNMIQSTMDQRADILKE